MEIVTLKKCEGVASPKAKLFSKSCNILEKENCHLKKNPNKTNDYV